MSTETPIFLQTLIFSFASLVQAECDAVEDTNDNGGLATIQAHHITKVAVEMLLDFS